MYFLITTLKQTTLKLRKGCILCELNMTFQIRIPSKCILAGEHTIIKQGFAIVAPCHRYYLALKYTHNNTLTQSSISGEGYNSTMVILWPVIERALHILEKDPSALKGYFQVKWSIPPCGGLGFSAALCVAVAKWAIYCGFLSESELFDFATRLEDRFHGKSSGVDIAGVLSEGIIEYSSTRQRESIACKWLPKLYLSSSGEQSISERCIKKVIQLRETQPEKANTIDNNMMLSCAMVRNALQLPEELGLPILTNALALANSCFYDWGLISPAMDAHICILQKHALACKVVGAGYGGHVLSLWKQDPPEDLKFDIFPLFGQDKFTRADVYVPE